VLTVKLSTSFPHWPLLRQTTGGKGLWKSAQFHVDQPVTECDVWFVYDGLTAPETVMCPPKNVIFVTAEPPSIKTHDRKWLNQFAQVISCRRDLKHRAVLLSQTGLPWHIGKTYDQLSQDPFPQKSKNLSVIASTKSFTPGHRQRLAFVEELQRHDCAEVFGRGMRDLPEKWDGLADYRYSVAIENCAYPDYWTEKIADCFLAGTVPFYYGCPNIFDYFPADSLVWIDLANPEKAIEKISAVLAKNDYDRRLPALEKAKQLVLNQFNLFHLLAEFCFRLDVGARRRKVHLKPEPA
jgi:hypothetical protein